MKSTVAASALDPNAILEALADDVQVLIPLLAPDLVDPDCETIDDAFSAAKKFFADIGADKPQLNPQRLHARQRYGSCELKSVLCFVANYVDYEVAFQVARHAVVSNANSGFFNRLSYSYSLLRKLRTRQTDANRRLDDAAHFCAQILA